VTSKVFIKLLSLFVLLLVFQTVVMEFIFRRLVENTPGEMLHHMDPEALWAGLIALLAAIPLAAWATSRISIRLKRVVDFAHSMADGDLGARLAPDGDDELSATEAALNQTAERLGDSFAEIENRRHELATMLDSMQEAVVAITPEGLVRWSNAVMQRISGTLIYPGRPLVHFVRDPEVLVCIRASLEQREVRFGRATSLAPGRTFEINAAPLPAGGALVVLHDVTAIEAAEKSRRDFIANVSHELRTPLTSIQG
jgi:two-component system phosphate regulon sensor histidine kinase PhoR